MSEIQNTANGVRRCSSYTVAKLELLKLKASEDRAVKCATYLKIVTQNETHRTLIMIR